MLINSIYSNQFRIIWMNVLVIVDALIILCILMQRVTINEYEWMSLHIMKKSFKGHKYINICKFLVIYKQHIMAWQVCIMLKKPWLYSRWGYRDSFQKSAFHVIWCGNILKLPMGDIFEVAELFFPWSRAIFLKISQMQWNLDFFAILAKYVAGVAKK